MPLTVWKTEKEAIEMFNQQIFTEPTKLRNKVASKYLIL